MPPTDDFSLEFDQDATASLRRIAKSLERIAELQELLVQIQAQKVGSSLEQVEATAEYEREMRAAEAKARAKYEAKVGGAQGPRAVEKPAALPVPMSLLQQSPAEIFRMDRAYQAAEREYGKGMVPPDIDLGRFAEEEGIPEEPGPELAEPLGGVPLEIGELIARARGEAE